MSLSFKITPRAQDDLKEIGRYTQSQWVKNSVIVIYAI
jgi:plasmid stabilization system protein ParE